VERLLRSVGLVSFMVHGAKPHSQGLDKDTAGVNVHTMRGKRLEKRSICYLMRSSGYIWLRPSEAAMEWDSL